MKKRRFLIALLAFTATLCSSCVLVLGDSSTTSNGGSTSISDTGSSDTGSSDTGSSDTGSSDTGSSDTDSSDTGSSDTGSSDTGSSDSSSGSGGSSSGGDSSSDDSSGSGSDEDGGYAYTDFTAEEKSILLDLFGETIPFAPNDEYYFEEYEDIVYGETGINFYTFNNTKADFDAYLLKFSAYTLTGTEADDYGDTWYFYEKGDLYVDLCFYETEGETCLDVYAYLLGGSEDTGGGSDSEGGDTNGDSSSGSEGGDTDGGVREVDFTRATNVKDVTDQGYYLDGCPTVGRAGVLVIPVEFSDVTARSKGYEISVLKNAFEKNGNTDYYSVYDYYYRSSYGKLDLSVTVLDTWFQPKYASAYYQNATMEYFGEDVAIGDQMIMDEALAYLEDKMDLSKFDSDGNGIIDAVVLVNTLDVGDDDFHWAYRYWNIYTDEQDYYYEYDGVSANDYLWASYQFLHEDGNGGYGDTNGVNTYTYIHEFGHVLGADDYYDTAYVNAPMGGFDVMDSMSGDHNAYTKFNYGWITDSRLVTTDTSITLTLESFSKTGDTILLANGWDDALGAYQEYYIVAYYTSGDLNDGAGGYFSRDGIVVYHVNAALYSEIYDGETYYNVRNNNTDPSDEYGTEDNLIEYVLNGADTYTYVAGDSLPSTTTDEGRRLGYTFTVDSLTGDSATITFRKVW